MATHQGRLAVARIFFSAMLLMWAIGLFVGVDAQTRTVGNISGTVRDPTGAVVPGARVVIQEQSTGLSRTVVANDEGFYSAPSLPFGRYSVSTAPPGFKKTQSREQELHVNENLVVNLTLEIGPVTETVIVSNDAAPVDFGISSQVMRHILVDHARTRQAAKRGGGVIRLPLEEAMAVLPGQDWDFVALDEALTRLAQLDPQQSQVVELRFFGGLSVEETAEVMKVSERTVKRDWNVAKAWLRRKLSGGGR